MEGRQIDPVAIFLMGGVVFLIALSFLQSEGPLARFRRLLERARNLSQSIDVLIEALGRIRGSWHEMVLPVVIYEIVRRLIQSLTMEMWVDTGVIFWRPSDFFAWLLLHLSLQTLVSVWIIRRLITSQGTDKRQLEASPLSLIGPIAIYLLVVVFYESNVSVYIGPFAQFFATWSFETWFGSKVYFPQLILPMIVGFLPICFVLPWVSQAIKRPMPPFVPFVQATWGKGIWLFLLLVMVTFVSSKIYFVINPVLNSILGIFFLLWQLAIIVTISERARTSITHP